MISFSLINSNDLVDGYYVTVDKVVAYMTNDVYLNKKWVKLSIEDQNRYVRMAENYIDGESYFGIQLSTNHAFPRDMTGIDPALHSFVIPLDITNACLVIIGILVEGRSVQQIKELDSHVGVKTVDVSVVQIEKSGAIPDVEYQIYYLLHKYRLIRTLFMY